MAYVVRVTHPEHGDRYKVFRGLLDAREVFKAADALVPDSRDAAYLYEVSGEDDPSAAVEAVKAGKAVILNRDEQADGAKLSPEEKLLQSVGL
jgi:hypothetical protein